MATKKFTVVFHEAGPTGGAAERLWDDSRSETVIAVVDTNVVTTVGALIQQVRHQRRELGELEGNESGLTHGESYPPTVWFSGQQIPLLTDTTVAPSTLMVALPTRSIAGGALANQQNPGSEQGQARAKRRRSGSAVSRGTPHTSSRPVGAQCSGPTPICIPLVVGGVVRLENPESRDKSHRWTVYLRGLYNEDLSGVFESVTFHLDPSFQPSSALLTAPPFELTRNGWGEFVVVMKASLSHGNCGTQSDPSVESRKLKQERGSELGFDVGRLDGQTDELAPERRGTEPAAVQAASPKPQDPTPVVEGIVELHHLLRFSPRPRGPHCIPPLGRAYEPEEHIGYVLVSDPVVTEHYDEVVIPEPTMGQRDAVRHLNTTLLASFLVRWAQKRGQRACDGDRDRTVPPGSNRKTGVSPWMEIIEFSPGNVEDMDDDMCRIYLAELIQEDHAGGGAEGANEEARPPEGVAPFSQHFAMLEAPKQAHVESLLRDVLGAENPSALFAERPSARPRQHEGSDESFPWREKLTSIFAAHGTAACSRGKGSVPGSVITSRTTAVKAVPAAWLAVRADDLDGLAAIREDLKSAIETMKKEISLHRAKVLFHTI